MTRLVTSALAAAPALIAAAASAHTGHGTPHLLHDAHVTLAGWVLAAAAAGVGLLLHRRKSRT